MTTLFLLFIEWESHVVKIWWTINANDVNSLYATILGWPSFCKAKMKLKEEREEKQKNLNQHFCVWTCRSKVRPPLFTVWSILTGVVDSWRLEALTLSTCWMLNFTIQHAKSGKFWAAWYMVTYSNSRSRFSDIRSVLLWCSTIPATARRLIVKSLIAGHSQFQNRRLLHFCSENAISLRVHSCNKL